jgi:HK97 family phage prohead protease
MNNLYKTKSVSLSIKDIDTAGRRVKIALSSFGNVDSDGDVILRGAFAKSITERGPETQSNRRIKFLRYHDFEHEIGVFKSLEETHEHLIAIGDLGKSTKGNDAFLDYQDGIITEHSIGFQTIQDKISVREDGIKEIKEVLLWEGSAVTFGANSETPVFSVSKGNHKEYLDTLNTKMNTLIGALKNGKGTDERLIQIEMDLRVIQSKYNSLINYKPSETLNGNEPNNTENNSTQFYKNLI